jgi:hypothetical protein
MIIVPSAGQRNPFQISNNRCRLYKSSSRLTSVQIVYSLLEKGLVFGCTFLRGLGLQFEAVELIRIERELAGRSTHSYTAFRRF